MDFLYVGIIIENGIKRECFRLKWYNKRLKTIEEKMNSLNNLNKGANRYEQMINNQMIKHLIERYEEINNYLKYYEEKVLFESNLTG